MNKSEGVLVYVTYKVSEGGLYIIFEVLPSDFTVESFTSERNLSPVRIILTGSRRHCTLKSQSGSLTRCRKGGYLIHIL